MTNKAIGDRKKQISLIKKVVATNRAQLISTNHKACFFFTIPAGISRTAVLGFNASNRSSIYRLKAMAALRANTIQSITAIMSIQPVDCAL